jgi:alpha-N-arabinofuranosidase
MYYNPIIRGFNPDPSICFANGRYYIAVSTFEYFPGVTVYESEDLANWRYCSSILDREDQLDLEGCRNSSGIYAPTLRYHDGRFYMVTTNKNIRWNFIVYSEDIHAGWSSPHPVARTGIDPSLFFDDDGGCYYTSNGEVQGERGIIGAHIDPDTGSLKEPFKLITRGCSGFATEGPHVYKRNGWYYLLISEGGTEYGHHCSILRSRAIDGPYEENPGNPVLSHTLRKGHRIQAVGHADLLQIDATRWIAVFLGVRLPGKALLHNLGRETFLASVTWCDDWPVIGDAGAVEEAMEDIDIEGRPSPSLMVDFNRPLSAYPLLTVRKPKPQCYRHDANNATLTLDGGRPLSEPGGAPTLLAVRQPEFGCVFEATLALRDLTGRAGVAAWYNSDYHLKLQVVRMDDKTIAVSLIRHIHDFEAETETATLSRPISDDLRLKIVSDEEYYRFFCDDLEIGKAAIASLCTEGTMYMTFTGVLFAIWAEAGTASFLNGLHLETRTS